MRRAVSTSPAGQTTDSHARSLAKAISWRALGTATTAALVLAMTGRVRVAIGVGAAECTAKIVLYFVHERLWNLVKLGRREP